MKPRYRKDHSSTLIFLIAVIAAFPGCASVERQDRTVSSAYSSRASNIQVEDEGVVTRLLEDDTSGIKHQRFIVQISSGQTVLIEHNTDIAPAVTNLQVGDPVGFRGEYVWNEKGGLVHWTHHDPEGRHSAGWLKHRGRIFE